ncbi:MAG: hypothetical protein HKN87_04660 [Saprospiraceae bacterium]|nr:hypothetical protein [Saprospiraceae bacterium]
MSNQKHSYSIQFIPRLILLSSLFTFSIYLSAQPSYPDNLDLEGGQSIFIGLSPEELSVAYDSIFLFLDKQSSAKFYYQNIYASACEDTLCKPIIITLMWDLLGNYQGFRLIDGIPLTKIDHEPFSESEYYKLHAILADDDSILGSFSKQNISKLLRTKSGSQRQYDVDAVSGATPPEIKKKIVEGALYTCHTLWHLCRGKIRNQLLTYTKINLLNEELLHQLFLTEKIDAITFAFKEMDAFGTSNYHSTIIKVIEESVPLAASQTINHIPQSLLDVHEFTSELWNIFPQLDYLSKKQILTKFSSCNQLPDNVLDNLIKYASTAIESQYVQILAVVFNQVNIPQRRKELLIEVSKKKKKELSNATLQVFATIPYHENNDYLKEEILQVLKN